MATKRRPLANVDPEQLSVGNGLDTSSAMAQMLGELAQIRAVETNTVSPYVGSVIPNLLINIRQLLTTPPTQPVSGAVNVANFPASQPVTGTFFLATQPVSGSVAVSNFPATQPVSGAVNVANFPASQPVTGAVQVAASTSAIVATRTPGYTPSSSPGTIALTTVSTLVDSVFIRAVKNTGGPNAAIVFIGTSGAATNQTIPLEPGAGILETAPAGKKLDLAQIYIRVQTANDAVSWIASN
jgi:hypothetical protein